MNGTVQILLAGVVYMFIFVPGRMRTLNIIYGGSRKVEVIVKGSASMQQLREEIAAVKGITVQPSQMTLTYGSTTLQATADDGGETVSLSLSRLSLVVLLALRAPCV